MKKLLLVLLICVVIDSGKEILKAGSIIISEYAEFRLSENMPDTRDRADKQELIVLNILLLPDECHCPR